MMHHNDNNSQDSRVGNKKKALGVVRGIWDLEWFLEGGWVCFLEAKVDKNTLTMEQETFRDRLRKRNERTMFHIFYSVEEFKEIIYSIKGR